MSERTDLQGFAEMAERFAKKELAPRAIELDNYPFVEFNHRALAVARETGLLNITVPEAQGGLGQGMEALCEVLAQLAREDAAFAAVVLVNAFARALLVACGRADAVGADRNLGFPVYDSPSDLQRGARAEETGEGFRLAGTVESVALAPVAGALLLPALFEKEGKHGLFLIDAGTAGVTVSPPVATLGLRGCPVGDVTLSVILARDSLVSRDPAGVLPAAAATHLSAAAALASGICEGSFRTARAYAAERYQGGRMIIDYPMIRQLLAGIAATAESSKAIFRAMAAAADRGQPSPLLRSGMLIATELAAHATTDGVQCLGGYGYMEDYGQEKRMRDAKQVQNLFGAAPVKKMELMEEMLA